MSVLTLAHRHSRQAIRPAAMRRGFARVGLLKGVSFALSRHVAASFDSKYLKFHTSRLTFDVPAADDVS